MKSKLWVFTTILIVASMVLTACGAKTVVETEVVTEQAEPTVQVEVAEVTEATSTPLPKGVVKITIFVGFGTGTSPEQQAVHKQLQDLFNSTHTDIQIEFLTVPYEERITKFGTMLAADQAADIAMPIGVNGIAEFNKTWLDQTPYIEADNYDMTRFSGATMDIHNYPGQGILGLPLCVYPTGVYYNTDIFDAAGVDYPPHKFGEAYADGSPWNYDTLVNIAKKMTLDANSNDANSPSFDTKNIKQFGWNGWDWASPIDFTRHFGDLPGNGVSADGTKSVLLEKQYVDAITFLKDAIWTHHVYANSEQAGSFYQNAGDPMESGLVGMWETHTWMSYAWPSWSAKFAWDVAAIPAGPNGKIIDIVDADTATISSYSKHPNEAWQVIKWLFEPEQYKVLINNYGCLPADKELVKTWVIEQSNTFPGVDFQVFVDALNYLEPAPNHEAWTPNFIKVQNTLTSKVLDPIMTGTNLDVHAVLKEANDEVQSFLDEYWATNK